MVDLASEAETVSWMTCPAPAAAGAPPWGSCGPAGGQEAAWGSLRPKTGMPWSPSPPPPQRPPRKTGRPRAAAGTAAAAGEAAAPGVADAAAVSAAADGGRPWRRWRLCARQPLGLFFPSQFIFN